MVSEGSPESINVWHNGKTVVTGPVNTGDPRGADRDRAPSPCSSTSRSTTMSGTNPDGSHYNDPGIPWVSYFNGGDALHGFIRASYGFPQSLGCVEMPYAEAARGVPVHADRHARQRQLERAGSAVAAVLGARACGEYRACDRPRQLQAADRPAAMGATALVGLDAGPAPRAPCAAKTTARPTRSTARQLAAWAGERGLEPAPGRPAGAAALRRRAVRATARPRARSRASSPRCGRCSACRSRSGPRRRTRPICSARPSGPSACRAC